MASQLGQLGLMKQILEAKYARLVDLQKSTWSSPASILRAISVLVDRGLLDVVYDEATSRKSYVVTPKGEKALGVLTELIEAFGDSQFETEE